MAPGSNKGDSDWPLAAAALSARMYDGSLSRLMFRVVLWPLGEVWGFKEGLESEVRTLYLGE